MMVSQVLGDSLAAGLSVTVAADPRFIGWFSNMGALAVVSPAAAEPLRAFLRRILRKAELFLPIAPETDYCLEGLVRTAVDMGVECLAPSPSAIRLASNKKKLGELAAKFGVSSVLRAPRGRSHAVKPTVGAGCEGVYRVSNKPANAKGRLITPWLAGEQLSLAAIFKRGEGRLLQVNRQHLVIGTRGKVELRWLESGVRVNRAPFERLVTLLARGLPGLWGFCGADVVRYRSRLWLVEVNPRLTTAYLGFYRGNPINWLLALRDSPPLARYPPPPRTRIYL